MLSARLFNILQKTKAYTHYSHVGMSDGEVVELYRKILRVIRKRGRSSQKDLLLRKNEMTFGAGGGFLSTCFDFPGRKITRAVEINFSSPRPIPPRSKGFPKK